MVFLEFLQRGATGKLSSAVGFTVGAPAVLGRMGIPCCREKLAALRVKSPRSRAPGLEGCGPSQPRKPLSTRFRRGKSLGHKDRRPAVRLRKSVPRQIVFEGLMCIGRAGSFEMTQPERRQRYPGSLGMRALQPSREDFVVLGWPRSLGPKKLTDGSFFDL